MARARASRPRISGSSKAFAQALHTSFHLFTAPTAGRFFQITRAARFPAAFAGRLSAVLGLSNLSRVSLPRPARRAAIAPPTGLLGAVKSSLPALGLPIASLNYPADYTPQGFWSMYDAPSSQTGSGQQLAIITEGDLTQPKKDLATFESKYGLLAVTWNQINVGAASPDTSGADEWDLDSQYSTGFAPGVSQLDVYVGPSLSDADIAATINRWATDDISKQGSFSAGECELWPTRPASLARSTRFSSRRLSRVSRCSSQVATRGRSARRWSASTACRRGPRGQLSGVDAVRHRRWWHECALTIRSGRDRLVRRRRRL
jgi:hypothetical protein